MIILENEDITDWAVPTAEDCSYLIAVPGATTCEVYMTMKDRITAEDTMATITDYHAGIDNVPTLTFNDNGGSNDSVVRDKGSWLDMGFRVGQQLTIAGGNTNDGNYTILAVTDDTIEVVTASFAAETTNTYTATAKLLAADWVLLETITAGTNQHKVYEMAGTGLRFVRNSGSGTIKGWVRT